MLALGGAGDHVPAVALRGGRLLLAAIFIGGGILHIVAPERYRAIMPAYLPAHDALIFWSGIAELAGGIGLLVGRVRRAAAIGLIILLVAVFPANVEMLRAWRERDVAWPGELLLWLRLPLQAVLLWAVWRVGVRRGDPPADRRPAE